jgi:hypothetical protein
LKSHLIFGVEEAAETDPLQFVDIDGGDLEVTVETLGNASHLGMRVPVESFLRWHDHEE